MSPLTGGLNANESSLGHSTDTQSNDDATIGENTVARESNDEMIRVLDKNDANDVGLVEHQMVRTKDTNVLLLFKKE